MKPKITRVLLGLFSALAASCASHKLPPIQPVAEVDLARFMGDWYVIACTPTWIDSAAYDAIESYRMDADGTIKTTFVFRQGGFDGPVKRYNPRGFVVENTGNAVWGMQFVWPIKAEYIIAELDDDYTSTIIARNARDYVWIMARTPVISDGRYQALLKSVASLGYDIGKLRKVPHSGH